MIHLSCRVFTHRNYTGWKRLLLADGPRQVINALTLYAFYLSKSKSKLPWWDLSKYFHGNDFMTTGLIVSTAFTCLIFAGSLLLLIVAGICYIPLLMHIQGNLKVRALSSSLSRPSNTRYDRNTAATKSTRYAALLQLL